MFAARAGASAWPAVCEHSLAARSLAQAARLLAEVPEDREHGHLAFFQGFGAVSSGDPEAGRALAEKSLELGCRLGDRDLQALGVMGKGRAFVERRKRSP